MRAVSSHQFATVCGGILQDTLRHQVRWGSTRSKIRRFELALPPSNSSIPAFHRLLRRFSSAEGNDPYTILGVSRNASPEEIKAAYKKLVLQYHPDQNKSPGAEEKFKAISGAYNLLRDANKRREFDTASAYTAHTDPTGGPYGAGAGPTGGYSYQRQGPSSQGAQFSKADADRVFREMFGNRDLNSIFREFQQQQQPQSGPSPFGNPNARVTRDEFVRDQNGTVYRVTTWTSGGDPNQQQQQQQQPTGDQGFQFRNQQNSPFGGAFGQGGSPFGSFFRSGNFWQNSQFNGRTGNPNQQNPNPNQGFDPRNIAQNPFYWGNQGWQFAPSPWRTMLIVLLIGMLFSFVLSFFLLHPGLTLLLVFLWVFLRRPPM